MQLLTKERFVVVLLLGKLRRNGRRWCTYLSGFIYLLRIPQVRNSSPHFILQASPTRQLLLFLYSCEFLLGFVTVTEGPYRVVPSANSTSTVVEAGDEFMAKTTSRGEANGMRNNKFARQRKVF